MGERVIWRLSELRSQSFRGHGLAGIFLASPSICFLTWVLPDYGIEVCACVYVCVCNGVIGSLMTLLSP